MIKVEEENGLASIAFPATSTGAFGYPMEEAARVAFRTIIEEAPGLSAVRRIRFVLFTEADRRLHARVLDELIGQYEV